MCIRDRDTIGIHKDYEERENRVVFGGLQALSWLVTVSYTHLETPQEWGRKTVFGENGNRKHFNLFDLWAVSYTHLTARYPNGKPEFPIVKDTTPNITNSRLNNIP